MSAIRSVVRPEDLSTALSQSQARQHIASLVGGPLGGILYGVTRWVPFAFDAVSFAARGCCSAGSGPTCPPPSTRAAAASRATTSPRASASSWAGRTSGRLATWSALANLLVNAMFFVAILRMVQDGVSPAVIGLVSTAAGVGGILGAIAAPGSSSGCRPARSSSPSPGASSRSSCRWCCGTTRPWSRPRSSPACSSTRPATRQRHLPDRAHPRPPPGPRGVRLAVPVDVGDLGGAAARRRTARRARRVGRPSPSSAAWSRCPR